MRGGCLTRKRLVFWKTGRWGDVVATWDSTVLFVFGVAGFCERSFFFDPTVHQFEFETFTSCIRFTTAWNSNSHSLYTPTPPNPRLWLINVPFLKLFSFCVAGAGINTWNRSPFREGLSSTSGVVTYGVTLEKLTYFVKLKWVPEPPLLCVYNWHW